MHVRKPIAALTLAACLACGPAWADSNGVVRVGITIVNGCTADTTPTGPRPDPLRVDCSGRVPYQVTITDRPGDAAYPSTTVPDERTAPRIATLTF